jgi:hypothetical protein
MDLKELEEKGGIVNGELVKKVGVLQTFNEESQSMEDYEFEYFVKRSSWLEYNNILKNEENANFEPALLSICANIRLGENGEQVIPYEVAERLESSAVQAFSKGISEVFAKKN